MEKTYAQKLNIVSAVVANVIAEGLSDDEISLLSTFFQTVGQNLDLIATADSLKAQNNSNDK